jgi:hypothetical protein
VYEARRATADPLPYVAREWQGGDVGGSGEGEGAGDGAAAAGAEAEAGDAPPRRATATVAFDKFTQVRNMLVMHIRKSEEEDTGEDGAGSGVKQVDLTNWYIGGAAQAEVSLYPTHSLEAPGFLNP